MYDGLPSLSRYRTVHPDERCRSAWPQQRDGQPTGPKPPAMSTARSRCSGPEPPAPSTRQRFRSRPPDPVDWDRPFPPMPFANAYPDVDTAYQAVDALRVDMHRQAMLVHAGLDAGHPRDAPQLRPGADAGGGRVPPQQPVRAPPHPSCSTGPTTWRDFRSPPERPSRSPRRRPGHRRRNQPPLRPDSRCRCSCG